MNTSTADLAADVVLFAPDPCNDNDVRILLIERGWAPFAGCWALPGGYVESSERFEQAARRELVEETGVVAPAELFQVGVYDALDRDPRGRVISVAFLGLLTELVRPSAGDDAVAARWVSVRSVLSGEVPVAFDHRDIVIAALGMQTWRVTP